LSWIKTTNFDRPRRLRKIPEIEQFAANPKLESIFDLADILISPSKIVLTG
jgi:hypothetical protein